MSFFDNFVTVSPQGADDLQPGENSSVGRHGDGDIVTGNLFDKYRSTNPIHQRLVNGFVRAAKELVDATAPRRVIEVGCGPGDLAHYLFAHLTEKPDASFDCTGIDIGFREIQVATTRHAMFHFLVASAYELPFPDDSADLVVACEVFEHLDDPEHALSEVARVCRSHLLISVPWEPIWRIFNVIRGAYIPHFGNTPGHVQHFSRRSLRNLVNKQFDIIEVRSPLPWTMLLGRKRKCGRFVPAVPNN